MGAGINYAPPDSKSLRADGFGPCLCPGGPNRRTAETDFRPTRQKFQRRSRAPTGGKTLSGKARFGYPSFRITTLLLFHMQKLSDKSHEDRQQTQENNSRIDCPYQSAPGGLVAGRISTDDRKICRA